MASALVTCEQVDWRNALAVPLTRFRTTGLVPGTVRGLLSRPGLLVRPLGGMSAAYAASCVPRLQRP